MGNGGNDSDLEKTRESTHQFPESDALDSFYALHIITAFIQPIFKSNVYSFNLGLR